MPEQWTIASDNEALRLIGRFLGKGDYLVGGTIRDLLLGKSPVDYDILTFGDVWEKASVIAKGLGSRPFWMDEDRGIARTVSADGITVDVCAPKGENLEQDLANRDITINAVALDLEKTEIIDLQGGVEDMKNGLIRAVSEKGFADDALRTLRCLRFAAVLDFSIEDETAALIKKYAPGLKGVAPERIKQELVSALSTRRGSRIFGLMEDTGIREILFPGYDDIYQGIYHRWSLIRHALVTAGTADMLIDDAEGLLTGSGGILSSEIEDGVDRACLLRLAAFIHDIGKPSTREDAKDGTVHFYGHASVGARIAEDLCRAMKFSSAFSSRVSGLVGMHMRVLDLACGGIITPRAIHRLLKVSEAFVPELLLLSLSDAIATGKDPGYKGARTDIEEIVRRVWAYYTDVFLKSRAQPLINGDDIMGALGMKPGPEVGVLLGRVEEARAEGIISNREEALDFIRSK